MTVARTHPTCTPPPTQRSCELCPMAWRSPKDPVLLCAINRRLNNKRRNQEQQVSRRAPVSWYGGGWASAGGETALSPSTVGVVRRLSTALCAPAGLATRLHWDPTVTIMGAWGGGGGSGSDRSPNCPGGSGGGWANLLGVSWGEPQTPHNPPKTYRKLTPNPKTFCIFWVLNFPGLSGFKRSETSASNRTLQENANLSWGF